MALNYRNKNQQFRGCVFSFGSGTQSTAILQLIIHEPQRLLDTIGHLPDYIVFADTGAESKESIDNFEHWRKRSPIPMYRVKNWLRNATNSPIDVPVFFPNGGSMNRKCTNEWKIVPVKRAIRRLFFKPSFKNPISLWLGISTDEITRMKESWTKYLHNVYPLIDLGLSRQDCYQILAKYNVKPIKSACYMCPYQGKRWKENKEIDKAIEFEKQLQAQSKYRETPYLHPSCQPIGEVYKQQKAQTELFSFDDECDGYCGV